MTACPALSFVPPLLCPSTLYIGVSTIVMMSLSMLRTTAVPCFWVTKTLNSYAELCTKPFPFTIESRSIV